MMTYKELKQKLLTCEKTLKCLQNGTYKNLSPEDIKTTQSKLNIIKEGILKEMKSIKDAVEFEDEKEAAAFADKNPETPVKIVKEAEFDNKAMSAIAIQTGKAIAKSLKQVGDEVATMKAKRIETNSFDIKVVYKNGNSDEFSFYISNDKLHLVDFTFDKELVDVGIKPSGEPIVHVDVLSNALVNHFRELDVKETKGAPKGHYFTKSGNLVKGRLTKDARERGARLSDPKDKQRSKVPPVTQYNNEAELPGPTLNKFNAEVHNAPSMAKAILSFIDQVDDKESPNLRKSSKLMMAIKHLQDLAGDKQVNEGEGDDHHYIKVPKMEYKAAMTVLDKLAEESRVKMDIVDSDGMGNVIIYFMFKDGDIASGEANSFMNDAVMDLQAYGINIYDHSAEMDETTNKYKIKPGTYAGRAVVVHMNGPETNWTVEFVKSGKIVDYADAIANLKFDDDTKPTDYMKRRAAEKDYMEEAELNKSEKKKLKDMSKSLKKSSKGHAGQAKYIDKLVKEGRGDMDMIKNIIRDRAAESGFEEREEAAEVIAGIADEYMLSLKVIQAYMDSDGPVNPFDVNELWHGDHDDDKLQEATDLYDRNGIQITRFAGREGRMVQINYGGKYIHISAKEYPFLVRAMQSVQGDLKDLTVQVPRRKNMDEAMGDDVPASMKGSVSKLQQVHSMIVNKMKSFAKMYKEKGGDHIFKSASGEENRVIDILKDLNNKKKKVEDALDKKVSGINKNQQLAETPEQEDAVRELRDIVDQVEELGDSARQIVRQNFPNEMSRMEGYGVFNLAYSNNRYDTTLGSEVDRLEGGDYDDLDDDNYPMEGDGMSTKIKPSEGDPTNMAYTDKAVKK
jgi:hypothetical protein